MNTKRLFIFSLMLTLLVSLFGVQPAHAACATQTGTAPAAVFLTVNAGDTISASRTGNGGTAPVVINFPNGSQAFGPGNASGTANTAGTANVQFPPPPNGDTYTITVCSAGSAGNTTGGSGSTSWSPGDPRINGQPGDHEAMYCNPGTLRSGTLGIILINQDSTGGPEVKFPYLMLVDAYPHQVSKDVGSSGIVTASMDLHLNFHVHLFGGPFHANGQGDNAKDGSCAFAVVPPILVGNVASLCPPDGTYVRGKFIGTDKVAIGLIEYGLVGSTKTIIIPQDREVIVCFPSKVYAGTSFGTDAYEDTHYHKVWVNGQTAWMSDHVLIATTDVFGH